MKSWSNWKELNECNVKELSNGVKGVYVIRTTDTSVNTVSDSDIIYIGCSEDQGIKERLLKLIRGQSHSAAQCIRNYNNLEFSWFGCSCPDGVEKALLLAFKVSCCRLPECNKKF